MKKTIVALTLVLAMLAVCLVGCATPVEDLETQKANAAAVFTLDVNPGVRIYVKEDNSVIALEATNEDGETIVAEIDTTDVTYEEVVELIVDKLEEKGYLEGESSSVLLSVEKKTEEISEQINERLNRAFEKHGKKAAIIEQELNELGEDVKASIDAIAEKHHISKGKANLIDKIREEFPELSEEELAKLKINDLGMILDEASEHIKEHFKKLAKPVTDEYVGKEQALATAIASLEALAENVTMQRVRARRDEGKMIYEVKFVYEGMEYEITLDAKTGEILSSESEEFEEFDAKGFIDDFCDKHGIDLGSLKDHFMGGHGHHDQKPQTSEVLRKGALLKMLFDELDISVDTLKKTEVELHTNESGSVFTVTLETDAGDVWELIVEAYTGTVIEGTKNGEAIVTDTDTGTELTPAE